MVSPAAAPANRAARQEFEFQAKIWWRQYTTLLWKNSVILRRRKLALLFALLSQALAPLLFLEDPGISAVSTAVDPNSFAPESLAFDGGIECAVEFPGDCVRVVYAPSGDVTVEATMSQLRSNTGMSADDVRGFPSPDAAQLWVAENLGRVEASVFFGARPGCEAVAGDPSCLAYEVLYNATDAALGQLRDKRVHLPSLRLQVAMETAFLQTVAGSDAAYAGVDAANMVYDMSYGRFQPYTTAETNADETKCDFNASDNYAEFVSVLSCITILYAISAFIFFQFLIEEREEKLLLSLRRIGLRDSAYHAAWFTCFAALSVVGCGVGAAIVSGLGTHTTDSFDVSIWFVMTWFFCIALFADVAFLASLSIFGGDFPIFLTLVTLLTVVLTMTTPSSQLRTYTYFQSSFSSTAECYQQANSFDDVYGTTITSHDVAEFVVFFMPWFHFLRYLFALCSNVALPGFDDYTWADFSKERELFSSGTKLEDFPSNAYDLQMLFWNIVIYMFLAWICGQLLSSDAGEGRSLWALFGPIPRLLGLEAEDEESPMEGDIRGKEQARSREEQSVVCYKVSKVFKDTTACKEISLTMPHNQVFVLLGHNGAGKSTLINLLTGAYAPTHGKAFINGLDVEKDNDHVQSIIGVCAQHDTLYSDLTAREHMWLNARFKGVALTDDVNREIDKVLSGVGLDKVADKLARSFSGGMKRRLSVAMSAVGNARILFLDEPTTGLDPVSKRAVWDTITYLKKDRIVLLTTHNMEEADYLGDRICIMHSGRVRAIGDSLFLKQRYGKGYQISVVLKDGDTTQARQQILHMAPNVSFNDTDDLRGVATGYLGLSIARRNTIFLPRLFRWLQRNMGHGVKEWGLSNTTLEQVFLILCAQNAGINYTADGTDADKCLFCGEPSDVVAVRTARTKVAFMLPDALCARCAEHPPFLAREFAWHMLGYDPSNPPAAETVDLDEEDKEFEVPLLEVDVSSEEEAPRPTLTLSYGEEKVEVESTATAVGTSEIGAPARPSQDKALPDVPGEEGKAAPMTRTEQALHQTYATLLNEAKIQSKKPQTVCCLLCCQAMTLAAFYLIALLIPVGLGVDDQCEGGYSLDDCSTRSVTYEIFGADKSLFYNQAATTLEDTYGTTTYGSEDDGRVIPAYDTCSGMDPWSRSLPRTETTTDACATTVSTTLLRPSMIWSDLDMEGVWQNFARVNSSAQQECLHNTTSTDGDCTALQTLWPTWGCLRDESGGESVTTTAPIPYTFFAPPDSGEGDYSSQSFSKQEDIFNALVDNSGSCPVWTELRGSPTLPEFDEASSTYVEYMADAGVECSDGGACDLSTWQVEGTLYVTAADDDGGSVYPYQFGNYQSPGGSCSATLSGVSVLFRQLITGLPLPGADGASSWWDGDGGGSTRVLQLEVNTNAAAKYLNMLTNSLALAANGASVVPLEMIGAKPYGNMDYYSEEDSNNTLAALTLLFFFLGVNLYFPLCVWRLGYEINLGIARFLEALDIKRANYISGVLLFDFLVFFMMRFLTLSIAVAAKLGLFNDIGYGYIFGWCLVSAIGMTGFSQLWVLPLWVLRVKNSHRLAAVAAGVVVIVMCLVNFILANDQYKEEDSFPAGLHIIPFMSEYRSLHWLLVRREPTRDYTLSCIFLLLFGFAGMLFSALSSDELVQRFQEGYQSAIAHVVNAVAGRGPVGDGKGLDGEEKYEQGDEKSDGVAGDVERGGAAFDEDLALMQQRTRDAIANPNEAAIAISRLVVEYPGNAQQPAFLAVRGLDLTIPFGETFALLGPNGAGKTTTIQVLSGMLAKTAGQVFVGGFNIDSESHALGSMLGIVPQFEVVWPELTVEEHLEFFCRTKGFTNARTRRAEVQRVAVAVRLDGDAFSAKAGQLSGGMRRRLAIGIAVIGSPPILYLDEPTTGLDPENRQIVWGIIRELRSADRMVLITTHSMVEAEALSTSIGIMVQGSLRCVGTSLHLKEKYGTGYSLFVNTPPGGAPEEEVDAFVRDEICGGKGDGELVSIRNVTRRYHLPNDIDVGDTFQTLSRRKAAIGISEWGLSMSTMEDVFIRVVTDAQ